MDPKNVPNDKPEGAGVTAGPKAFEDLFAKGNAEPNSVISWLIPTPDEVR
jgi:hypothetical protein